MKLGEVWLEGKGQPKPALEWFQRYCERFPESIEAQLHLARCHLELGDSDTAQNLLAALPNAAASHFLYSLLRGRLAFSAG